MHYLWSRLKLHVIHVFSLSIKILMEMCYKLYLFIVHDLSVRNVLIHAIHGYKKLHDAKDTRGKSTFERQVEKTRDFKVENSGTLSSSLYKYHSSIFFNADLTRLSNTLCPSRSRIIGFPSRSRIIRKRRRIMEHIIYFLFVSEPLVTSVR